MFDVLYLGGKEDGEFFHSKEMSLGFVPQTCLLRKSQEESKRH